MDRKFFERIKTPYISHNDAETANLANELADSIEEGDVVALTGNLGAGKTTFTKALARALEIPGNVSSPTFNIVKEYRSGRLPLFHFDVYRLGSEEEFYDIGGEEYLFGRGVSVIEWADIISEALPPGTLLVNIKYGDNEEERIFSFAVK